MRYFIALIFPPLAVLLTGRLVQLLLNIILCFLLWIPGIIHALLIVSDSKAKARNAAQLKQLRKLHKKGIWPPPRPP
jgi:uncharacterized membrane protein YqaE (UPF0057 family)